jgi:predicted PurR-regulated permease PerM
MSKVSTDEPIGPFSRPVTILLGLAALVVSVAGLRAFGGTLAPAFLALILVVTVHPLQDRLIRRGVPAWVGVLVLLVTVYAVLLGLAAALAISIAQLAAVLPDYRPQFSDLVDQLTAQLAEWGVGRSQIDAAVDQLDLSNVVSVLQQILGGLSQVLSNLFFILVLILFLGIDAARFPRRLREAARTRPHLVTAMYSFAGGTRRYVWVSTVFGLIVAVLDVGALYLLAIPLPLLWGLLSFITNYVPNIGFLLGLIPPALLGLLEGGVGRMLWVIVAYSLINVVIQSFIQPKVVGDAVGLSATLTFLSLVFWTFVLGPLGALLAVPLTLLVKALLIDADPSAQWLRPLLGDEPLRDGPAPVEADPPADVAVATDPAEAAAPPEAAVQAGPPGRAAPSDPPASLDS